MTQKSYDYAARTGVLPISWDHFHAICKALAMSAAAFAPEVILPVGRGGYYPGTLIAHMLQVEVYPIRISRRVYGQIAFAQPQWSVEPPALVQGKRVLIVDEISSEGETLSMVIEKVSDLQAKEIRSAVLYAHTRGAAVPDYIGLISDALILNPWDREILQDGTFQIHPEYLEALALQDIEPDPSFIIAANPPTLAKG